MAAEALSTPMSPAGESTAGRASPLELFFDLVYVFAFMQVTHLMAHDGDVRSVLNGLAVLGVLWWSWASHAWLGNNRTADRGAVGLGIVIAIAIVLVLSIVIPETYPSEGESRFGAMVFAIGFVVLSTVYTVVNLLTGRGDRAFHRQVLRTMGTTIIPVSAALVIGAVLGGAVQLVLWLTAVVVEGVIVFTTSRGGRWELPSAAHYADRHRLVVMLALGESIIAIGVAASSSPLTPAVVGVSLLAVSLALGLWWIYFGRLSPLAERHIEALFGTHRTTVATIGTYLHFGIVAGILLVSLGLGGVIEATGRAHLPEIFPWSALAVGLTLFVVSTAAYSAAARPRRTLPAQVATGPQPPSSGRISHTHRTGLMR
jgi:low temperature requirement protein LtrA